MNNSEQNIILSHYKRYPNMQIQDLFKFLYQSSYGCEHLVSSIEEVTDYIKKEYNSITQGMESEVEPLDGKYSRVPLSYLNKGLSANTFGKLFFLSAKKEENGLYELKQKLKKAEELISNNQLPFSKVDFKKAIIEWKEKNYCAIHHSEIFNKFYKPSYRVISNDFIPFLPLFTRIDKLLLKGNAKIAIEGGSASGKTTLSNILKKIYDCTIFHMDDFFLRPEQRTKERYNEIGGNIDRERFLSEVLIPLSSNDVVTYRKFDCSTMSLTEEINVIPQKLCIIEGAYSMHPELQKYYDLSVFLIISPIFQKERILKRNTLDFANCFYDEWIPLEERYFTQMNIKSKCDIVINITS